MFSSKVPELPLAGGQNGGALCFVSPGGCPPASYVVVKRRRVSPLFPAALLDALVVAVSEELGDQAVQRLSRLHQMKKAYRT